MPGHSPTLGSRARGRRLNGYGADAHCRRNRTTTKENNCDLTAAIGRNSCDVRKGNRYDVKVAINSQGYIESFRNELLAVTHAAGYPHPGCFTPDDVEVSSGPGVFKTLREIYDYDKPRFCLPDQQLPTPR
jgi:hypothetical protein